MGDMSRLTGEPTIRTFPQWRVKFGNGFLLPFSVCVGGLPLALSLYPSVPPSPIK